MKNLTFVLPFVVILTGCGIESSYVKTDDTSYPSTSSVKVLLEKPQEEYITIGLISASSTRSMQNDEEAIFEELKQKARSFGAHAVIIKSRSNSFNPWGGLLWGARIRRIEAEAIRFKTPRGNT